MVCQSPFFRLTTPTDMFLLPFLAESFWEDDKRSAASRTVRPRYRYNTSETGTQVEVEMPGVAKENITVEVNGHNLVLKGTRFRAEAGIADILETEAQDKEKEDAKGANHAKHANRAKHANEAAVPAPSVVYLLEIQLGHKADVDAIKAQHPGNGILTLSLPRKAEPEPRRITIA